MILDAVPVGLGLGVGLGQGIAAEALLSDRRTVAEGAATAPVRQIAAQAALVQAYEIEIFDELLATSYA